MANPPLQILVGGFSLIRVLYVDDEEDLLCLAKEFLSQNPDLEIITAESVPDARSILAEREIDVVVSDYQMPGEDGLVFLRTLRKTGIDIPFILFSGRGREEVVISALNYGADFYIKKGTDIVPQFAELVNSIRQVYEKREAKRRLEEYAHRFKALLQNTSELIVIIDQEGNVEYVSPSVEPMLGFDLSSITRARSKEFLKLLGVEDVRATSSRLLHSSADSVSGQISIMVPDAMGRVHSLQGSWTSVGSRYEQRIIFNWLDVSEKVDMDSKVRESQRTLQGMFDVMPGGLHITDRDGRLISMNREVVQRFHLEGVDMEGADAFTILPDTIREALRESFFAVVRSGQRSATTYNLEGRTYAAHFFPVFAEDGSVDRVCTYSFDTTTALEDLARGESMRKFYRAVLDQLPIPIWETSSELKEVWLNREGRRLLGLGNEEHLDSWRELVHPEDAEVMLEQLLQVTKTNEAVVFTGRLRCNDGAWHRVIVSAQAVKDAAGSVIGYTGGALRDAMTGRIRSPVQNRHISK